MFLNGPHQSRFTDYATASQWAISHGITSHQAWCERKQAMGKQWPESIPSNPDRTYKVEFRRNGGWGGFLGTQTVATQWRTFAPYEDAQRWAKTHGVRSFRQWLTAVRDVGKAWPESIPKRPDKVYAERFQAENGWRGFLGTGMTAGLAGEVSSAGKTVEGKAGEAGERKVRL